VNIKHHRRIVNLLTRAGAPVIAATHGVPVRRWAGVVGITGAVTAMYELAPHTVRLIMPTLLSAAAVAAAVRAARRGPAARRIWLAVAMAMAVSTVHRCS
jgi:hypothetical protein